jgi:hypothetical protein
MKLEIKHTHYVPLAEALLRIKSMIDKKRRENPKLVNHIEWKYGKSQGKRTLQKGIHNSNQVAYQQLTVRRAGSSSMENL